MWLKRVLISIVIIIVVVILSVSLFLGSVYLGIFGPLPEKEDLIGITHEEASLVLSNDGTVIGKFFAENRTNINWSDVPDHLIKALIATEDKRFFEHEGIDGRSYLRVLFKTILLGDKSAGGGSTLTQQLVKNLFGRKDHSFLSMPVSKTREAIIASRMEDVLSKEGILLLYLNSVPFGEEVFGIEAAAERFFGKKAKDLQIEESALLVGILKANTYYNPRLHPDHATARRNQVIALMAQEGFIDESDANRLQELKLELSYTNYQLESPAGYFVYQVKKRAEEILENRRDENAIPYDIRKDGLKIYTTLDINLQKLANYSTRKQLKRMQPMLDRELVRFGKRKKWEHELTSNSSNPDRLNEKHNIEILTPDGMITKNISKLDSLWHYYKMLNAAVLAANPKNGAVLAWTGGNNFRYLPYDMVLSKRQVASTIKPIIYAAALEDGFEACDYFENRTKQYHGYENWKPENYDKSSSDDMKVAMWYALTRSMNLPTVDIYFETGHEQVADMCRRLNLDAPYEETPSIALGAIDASLYDMVKAYSAFANGGLMPGQLIMIEKITDSEGQVIYRNESVENTRVMEPEIANQITFMLEKAVDEGTGIKIRNGYGIKSDLAGKTGTAQNYSDAWFMAYTPDLVIGSWVGARSPQMHFNSTLGSGSALALPISGNILAEVEKNSTLQSAYLTNFDDVNDSIFLMDCEPYKEKWLAGIFKKNKSQEKVEASTETEREDKPHIKKEEPKKERSKFGKFFDNIFKRKDKKKKKKKNN